MQITTVPFEDSHFYRMRLREEDAADLIGADVSKLLREWRETGTETAMLDGDPAFIFGSCIRKDGNGYLWAVATPLVDKCALYATKRTRARVQEMFVQGAKQVEAYCHKSNERALRWLTKGIGMRVMGDLDESRYWLVITPGCGI